MLMLCVVALALQCSNWPHPVMTSLILQPPSTTHWLGTDTLGRDVLLRLIEALPTSLWIALGCAALQLAIGLVLASISAVGGPYLDILLVKMTDIFLLIPALLPMMLLAALLQPGLLTAMLIIGLLCWPDDFRVLRAAIRRQLFSDAVHHARCLGATRRYLLRQYVWPALVPLFSALFLQNARQAIMISAGLAFLGLTDPRLPNWGSLLMQAQEQIHSPAFWWLIPGPVLAITLLTLLLNQLHRSLRSRSV